MQERWDGPRGMKRTPIRELFLAQSQDYTQIFTLKGFENQDGVILFGMNRKRSATLTDRCMILACTDDLPCFQQLQVNLSTPWPVELAKEDTLPGTQNQVTILHQCLLRAADQ